MVNINININIPNLNLKLSSHKINHLFGFHASAPPAIPSRVHPMVAAQHALSPGLFSADPREDGDSLFERLNQLLAIYTRKSNYAIKHPVRTYKLHKCRKEFKIGIKEWRKRGGREARWEGMSVRSKDDWGVDGDDDDDDDKGQMERAERMIKSLELGVEGLVIDYDDGNEDWEDESEMRPLEGVDGR